MLNSCTVAAFDVSVMCNARAQHEDVETNQQGMCVKGCKYGLGSREVGGRLELSQVDRDHVMHDTIVHEWYWLKHVPVLQRWTLQRRQPKLVSTCRPDNVFFF